MIKIIMHGCCGAMGRVITSIAAEDPDIAIVAGIDKTPVFHALIRCLRP